jgi:fumarate hydratase, class I
MRVIQAKDIVKSIADAMQYVSYYHPSDFVEALKNAYQKETSAPARNALLQLLVNSKLSAQAKRPVCQDTGVAHVFFKIGMDVRIEAQDRPCTPSLQTLANEGVSQAYLFDKNPLRASMIRQPLGKRKNTGDNTPAIVHVELVEGDRLEVIAVAKGGGGDVKARYAMLNPSDSVADWVESQLPGMGAGWCPPGVLGLGVGGTPEQAMLMAKRALFAPIDIQSLKSKSELDETEQLRLEVFDRINALGIGAQGLGGDTTILDVKIETAPCHAALQPVALVPNCAATRFISFTLDGSGPAVFTPPDPKLWDGIPGEMPTADGRRVDLDMLTPLEVASWKAGELLLLSGKLLTGRDAAHKRMSDALSRGETLPVSLKNRAIFYVGPVDPIEGEAVGPAGPTTSTRMDKFMPTLLEQTGLLVSVGKAERGPVAIEAIKKAGAAYLVAVGGAAYLVSKAIESAKVLAYEDLGMEAIYEFVVRDMPVTVAVDARGRTIHWISSVRTSPE